MAYSDRRGGLSRVGAVLLRTRSELFSNLRSWLGLALLVGLIGGLVIAAAAGARRTASAYDRFLEDQRAADILVDNYPDPGVATFDPATVTRLPQVKSSARAAFLFIAETGALAPTDGRLGREINRFKLLEGRLPERTAVGEVVVGFERARERHWEVGTRIPLVPARFADDAARVGVRNIRLTVVGIVAAPGDFPPLDPGAVSIYLTPAFHAAYAGTPLFDGAGKAVIARLERGAEDVRAFRAELEQLAGGRPFSTVSVTEQAETVRRSLDLQALALWLFAALLALTGLLVVSHALARQTFLAAGAHPTLRALGMTRRQLWAEGVLRSVAVGVLGALIALALASALSPLTPLGRLARMAEPELGVSIDAAAFAIGGAAVVLITVALAVPAVWLAARGGPERRGAAPGAGSAAALVARLGASAPVQTGVRMALEPGARRSAVPVRTTIAGVTVSVTAFVAALTFGSSSGHLLDTPRLYGWNWDLALVEFEGSGFTKQETSRLARDAAVEGLSVGGLGQSLEVDGRRISGMALDRVTGSVLPPVIEGRAPAESGEILVGARTMRALGAEIGDTITVRVEREARMEIVGLGVLPAALSNTARLGEGAMILARDARRLSGERPTALVMRLVPGTDRRALVERLRRELGAEDLYVVPLQEPLDIVDFGRVRGLPLVLAAVLGGLAAATLAHMLVSGVRRRRRDLAILKTLGFVRRQVLTVIVAQSLTYAAVALVIGLPLGVGTGRFAWGVFAERQGIVTEVVVPWLALVLAVVPAAALIAVTLAVLPARWAASTRPASLLRAE